jgi:hypothetical protein
MSGIVYHHCMAHPVNPQSPALTQSATAIRWSAEANSQEFAQNLLLPLTSPHPWKKQKT